MNSKPLFYYRLIIFCIGHQQLKSDWTELGCVKNAPTIQFPTGTHRYTQSNSNKREHWLSVSEISKIIHCRIAINMPYYNMGGCRVENILSMRNLECWSHRLTSTSLKYLYTLAPVGAEVNSPYNVSHRPSTACAPIWKPLNSVPPGLLIVTEQDNNKKHIMSSHYCHAAGCPVNEINIHGVRLT